MEPVIKIYDSFHELHKKKGYRGDKVEQFSAIILLGDKIEEHTGRLVDNGNAMTCDDIAKALGEKKEKVAILLTDLMSNDVIHSFDGAFYFNPRYIEMCYVPDEERVEVTK